LWCSGIHRKLEQHIREISKMQDKEHMELIPLVEVALAIMRLSCEKFFVLISVLAAYLIFRDDVPWLARVLIRVNHRISMLFQRVWAGPFVLLHLNLPVVVPIIGEGTLKDH
jgi:predicted membrane protein